MIVDKLSRPLKDLRISVTDRCNFRCTYCMPAEIYGERYRFLPKTELLTYEEIARLVRIFVQFGVTKIRLTGGEPLVRVDVSRLISLLAKIEDIEDLTLTTNGYMLARYAQELKTAGLRRVTVSLDSLDDAVFQEMNGRNHTTHKVLEGIQEARRVGLDPIKINVVVQKNVNDHTLVDIARYFKGTGIIVRFIEFMDVGTLNGWRMEQVVPAREVVDRINAEMPIRTLEENYFGEVASRYEYIDGSGEVGIIASVTEPFCANCTRARLSPEGELFTCLFNGTGLDLREPMRAGASDEEVAGLIMGAWSARDDRYSEIRSYLAGPQPNKVEMYHIGG